MTSVAVAAMTVVKATILDAVDRAGLTLEAAKDVLTETVVETYMIDVVADVCEEVMVVSKGVDVSGSGEVVPMLEGMWTG